MHKPRFKRIGRGLALVALVLIAIWFIYSVAINVNKFHADYLLFYYAFEVVWHGFHPSLLYDMQAQQAYLSHLPRTWKVAMQYDQYLYPPQFAVLFSWLAAIKYHIGMMIWAGATVCTYIASLWMLFSMTCPRPTYLQRILLYVMAMSNLPFLWDFLIGNSNWLIFFLLICTFWLEARSRGKWISGIPLGLAIVFKLTPAFVFVYALWKRKWKMAVVTGLTVLVTTAITASVVGWHTIGYYLLHVGAMGQMSMRNGGPPYNSSVMGILQGVTQSFGLAISHRLAMTITGLFDLGICLVIFLGSRRNQNEPHVDASWAVLGVLLLSPLLEIPHLLLAWIPMATVLGLHWKRNVEERMGMQPAKFSRRWIRLIWIFATAFSLICLSDLGWFIRLAIPIMGFLVMIALLFLLKFETRKRHLSVTPFPEDVRQTM